MKIRSCPFFALVLSLLFSACSLSSSCDLPRRGTVTLMTWNAQAFFDASENGCEFAEYRGSGSVWSAARYVTRLDRLREVLFLAGRLASLGPDRSPDLVVLQEIENSGVIRDICNRLPASGRYREAVFVPPPAGCAFGSAILSRYPLRSWSAHTVDSLGIPVRPLVEAEFLVDGIPLTVFAVHWKSKAGDASDGGVRFAQERLLAERIAALRARSPGEAFIACGDFNQRLEEFTLLEDASNPWVDWLDACATGQVPGPAGSYWYDGAWETIDHIFYGGIILCSFTVVSSPPAVTPEQVPARYVIGTGAGYSDHLPLVLSFTLSGPDGTAVPERSGD